MANEINVEEHKPEVDIKILLDSDNDISDISVSGKLTNCLSALCCTMIEVALKGGYSKEHIINIVTDTVERY